MEQWHLLYSRIPSDIGEALLETHTELLSTKHAVCFCFLDKFSDSPWSNSRENGFTNNPSLGSSELICNSYSNATPCHVPNCLGNMDPILHAICLWGIVRLCNLAFSTKKACLENCKVLQNTKSSWHSAKTWHWPKQRSQGQPEAIWGNPVGQDFSYLLSTGISSIQSNLLADCCLQTSQQSSKCRMKKWWKCNEEDDRNNFMTFYFILFFSLKSPITKSLYPICFEGMNCICVDVKTNL